MFRKHTRKKSGTNPVEALTVLLRQAGVLATKAHNVGRSPGKLRRTRAGSRASQLAVLEDGAHALLLPGHEEHRTEVHLVRATAGEPVDKARHQFVDARSRRIGSLGDSQGSVGRANGTSSKGLARSSKVDNTHRACSSSVNKARSRQVSSTRACAAAEGDETDGERDMAERASEQR